jgi:hypothetical protein
VNPDKALDIQPTEAQRCDDEADIERGRSMGCHPLLGVLVGRQGLATRDPKRRKLVVAALVGIVIPAALLLLGCQPLPGSAAGTNASTPTNSTAAPTTTTSQAGMVQAPLSSYPSITVSVPAVTPSDEVVSDSNGERCLKPYEEITIAPLGSPYQDYVFDLGVSPGEPMVTDVAASNPAIGPNHILCYFPGETAR